MNRESVFAPRLRTWYYLTLSALVIGCCTYWVQQSSAYAYGMDGYYYAAQIKSYWLKGRFFSRDSSPVLYAMTWFSRLGPDIVVMNKIFISLVSAVFIFPAYLFGRYYLREKSAFWASLITASVVFTSMFRLTYVKNFCALVFFLLFLRAMFRASGDVTEGESGVVTEAPLYRRFIPMFFWLMLCALSHKLTAGLAFVCLMVYLLAKRHWLLSVIMLLVLAAFILAAERFSHVLRMADLVRFDGLFTWPPVLPPLAFGKAFSELKLIVVEGWFLFIAAVMGALLASRSAKTAVLTVLLVIAANPLYNYDPVELGFRFYLLLIIPAPIFLMKIVERMQGIQRFPVRALAPLSMMLAFGLLLYGIRGLYGLQQADPLNYKQIAAVVEELDLPERHLLIVHQGFDYYYCYRRKGDAFHFLPEAQHGSRPVYRMAYRLPDYFFRKHALGLNKDIRRYGPDYTLMPEALWQSLVEKFTPIERRQFLNWRNPHKHRDSYMQKHETEGT